MTEDRSLELSADELRALVDAATRRVIEYVESLPRQPSADTEGGGDLARSLVEPLPEKGRPYEELLDLVFDRVIRKGFGTAGPGYLAYIPGGGIVHSAVADFVADAVNRYVGVFEAAPGLAQIEANVVRWFCDIVGYPAAARGFLTTGGSLANFSALVTARRERLPEDFLAGVLYASDQAHHSVEKAAMLAGFPAGSVRSVPSDDAFRIRLDVLAKLVAEDRVSGRRPFLVVGNAGTTNTGAVDDLEGLAALCAREGLWLHVDAAYGGFFLLTTEGRRRLAGIDRADSVVLDPHKGLFLPYGTGSLLVKDGDALRRAHALSADYMPPMQSDPELADFNLISPELSRDWRGLRVWLPIAMHGIGPFRANLEEKLELTRWATEELRKIPGIEIVAEPQLSIVAFRLTPRGSDVSVENERNRTFLSAINARRRVYLTGTMLGPRFALRICVLSFRTHRDRMRQCLEDVRAAADELGAMAR
ncbi:MAG: aminotransferase class I/II-fold pyridoxal phosphate-dependent enzyme [Acidobacteriota bacterium]|nr:aminotransferase class I/II-fold pyridoxal phosphate-dependent enzyme [Acidobacteriota bacterium]MDQ5870885.1 aminotransferase class I/II-fold pyridoxal phosphate-dependent enzyme [Acidobacteriota bacterium]